MVPARVNVVFNVIKQKKKKKKFCLQRGNQNKKKKRIIQHTDLVSVEDQGEV